MDVQLIRATANDAQNMLNMQKKCFKKHFEKYQDLSGSPYKEVLEKMLFRINYEKGSYYKIVSANTLIGGIWVFEKESKIFRVGIVYILPEYQSKGVGQKALAMAENLHRDAKGWELDYPEDLSINRRCYEKTGYTLTGEKEMINEKLTLVCYKK
jgi:GNAT superfamily N-acetyltransferase